MTKKEHYLWVCDTDWYHEIGEAKGPYKFYNSPEEIPCVDKERPRVSCRPVRVRVEVSDANV